jgi:hypothetical protein
MNTMAWTSTLMDTMVKKNDVGLMPPGCSGYEYIEV